MEYDLHDIIKEAFNSLIIKYNFVLEKQSEGWYLLKNENCCISLKDSQTEQNSSARVLEVEFYDPKESNLKYNSTSLQLFRKEPKDIQTHFSTLSRDSKISLKEKKALALKFHAKHTEKYRQDILSGDFESWKAEYNKNKGY